MGDAIRGDRVLQQTDSVLDRLEHPDAGRSLARRSSERSLTGIELLVGQLRLGTRLESGSVGRALGVGSAGFTRRAGKSTHATAPFARLGRCPALLRVANLDVVAGEPAALPLELAVPPAGIVFVESANHLARAEGQAGSGRGLKVVHRESVLRRRVGVHRGGSHDRRVELVEEENGRSRSCGGGSCAASGGALR